VSNGGHRQVDPFGASAGPGGVSPGTDGNGIAVAAMVCGIIALLITWMPFIVVAGFVLAVLAVVFGIKGHRRSRETQKGAGPAIAGIVTGLIALLLSIVGIVLSVVLVREVIDFTEPGPVTAEVVSCTITDDDVIIEARLRNDSDEIRDYTVFGLVRAPRGDDGDTFAQLYDIEPGEVVDFELRRSWFGSSGDCDALLVVQGPFPFGFEIDRTNDAIDGRLVSGG